MRRPSSLDSSVSANRSAPSSHLHATGVEPRGLAPRGLDALTASERRIAEMATEGLTDRQIAQALFLTVRTIETHMTRVLRKLDVGSREELGAVVRAG